jgi:hypothetical protein
MPFPVLLYNNARMEPRSDHCWLLYAFVLSLFLTFFQNMKFSEQQNVSVRSTEKQKIVVMYVQKWKGSVKSASKQKVSVKSA